MTPVVFGPTGAPHGRVLTLFLVPFAGMWAYFGLCLGTCSVAHASPGFLLFAAVVFGLGIAAWNWRPHRAWITLAQDGMTVHAEGTYFVPKRTLAWDQVAEFAHVPGQPKSTSFFRVTLHPVEGAKRSKSYNVPMQGMATTPQKILGAAAPFMEQAGYRADGPLPMAHFTPRTVAVIAGDAAGGP